ncbi:MAG: DUF3237 domain-containing protein [Pontiellaceae bacterium]|nr:DUF3237 domain-containing protein [Pontiellaceae bacterium]MBN2786576.1 DUF3237 domain-containing protein [Pontiellaceae bacterium]
MSYRLFCFLVLSVLSGGEGSSYAHPVGEDDAVSGKMIVPASGWSCGMPDGIPCPEDGRLLFEISMELGQVYVVGETPYGDRTVFVVQEGKLTGSGIQAAVMPGGLDFQLALSNGVLEIEQLLVLKTSDGQTVFMRNAGVGLHENDVRVAMDFEAPADGLYAWLNTGRFVARRVVDPHAMTMTLSIYDVADVAAADAVKVAKPTDRLPQPWDYRKGDPSEERGELLISERVTLGQGISVGASKRGVRHIIPITGGVFSGDLKGRVVAGGADYQLQADTFTLDARYLWQTDDRELIIVRNSGAFGALVPSFETRVDGPYAWLNTGKYLSGDPEVGADAVQLNLYKSQ